MDNRNSSFEDLVMWQKMHNIVLDIYKITKSFPKEEIFGVTNQIRRASVSVAANIVEGYGKKSKADKLRFFNISQGSLEETKYFLRLAKDLGYYNTDDLRIGLDEVGKMLKGYVRAISGSDN
ncbi:MAG: four helix bundle protein [Ignavibacteria bacterium]|nr:four helix bundle protein [Ignavibacteria bacterium]